METSAFAANKECRECPSLPASSGGCRARALYYNGDKNARDPYCCALHEKKLFIDSYRYLFEEACQNGDRAFQ